MIVRQVTVFDAADVEAESAFWAGMVGGHVFYDVFPDEDARDAHLAGGVGQVLGPNTGVLFSEPQIEKIDIIADNVPA